MQELKFSIITPTLNSESVIEKTVASILGQNYPSIECIVVDGASTDSTVEILKRYGDKVRWISEPDSGPAEAINKGLRMATGDIIGIMPAGDCYEPGIFKKSAEVFGSSPEIGLVYGDYFLIESGRKIYYHLKPTTYHGIVRSWAVVCQPASFARRQIFEATGPWDETLTIAAHYEWLIRAFARAKTLYLPLPIFSYREHPDAWSGRNPRETARQLWIAGKRHGAKFYHPIFWQSILSARPSLFRIVKRLPGYRALRNTIYALFGR